MSLDLFDFTTISSTICLKRCCISVRLHQWALDTYLLLTRPESTTLRICNCLIWRVGLADRFHVSPTYAPPDLALRDTLAAGALVAALWLIRFRRVVVDVIYRRSDLFWGRLVHSKPFRPNDRSQWWLCLFPASTRTIESSLEGFVPKA